MGRSGQGQVDVDRNGGVGLVVDVADQSLVTTGISPLLLNNALEFPGNFGKMGRGAAQDLAIEEFHDCGPALVPPMWAW